MSYKISTLNKSRSKGTKLNVNANKLNNTFAEHLKNHELRDGLEKPFKQLVTYAFSKNHSNKHFDLKQLSAQKKKAKTQLDKLEERFAIGEIGQDLYQKYTQKFSDEMAEIEQKIDFGQNGSSNLEMVTDEAIKVSKNLSSTWLDMSFDQKYELQQFVFPKGASYNKENNRVRTPETHLLFELTKKTTGNYEDKKSGTLSQNEMNSALLDLSGLISNFLII